MVNNSYSFDGPSSIPPARLFKAFVNDDEVFPKALPHIFKSIQNVQGDGGVGSVKLVTYGEGAQFKSAKHRVEAIDHDNFTYKHTVIEVEGGNKKEEIESVTYEFKVVPSGDGGSVVKTTATFSTKGDAQIGEELIKTQKERGLGMIKAVEAYLISNPQVYN